MTGRHSSRSGDLNNYVDNNRSTNSTMITTIAKSNGRATNGGRESTITARNFYDRGWRDPRNFSKNQRALADNGDNTRSSWVGYNNVDPGGATRSSINNSPLHSALAGGLSGGGSSSGGHWRGRN